MVMSCACCLLTPVPTIDTIVLFSGRSTKAAAPMIQGAIAGHTEHDGQGAAIPGGHFISSLDRIICLHRGR